MKGLVLGLTLVSCQPLNPPTARDPLNWDLTQGRIPLDWDLNLYRNPEYRERVEEFFISLTGSAAVTKAVLEAADAHSVPPSLAFALAWQESRFVPRAQGTNANGSRDRGLFQLNNRAFPDISDAQAFDPVLNAQTGLRHLRQLWNQAGSLSVGLAMYNAGPTRVAQGGTPRSTLNYIDKILAQTEAYENQLFDFMALRAPAGGGVKLAKSPASLLDMGRSLQ